jgi:uncharacterized protein (DUF488 family)
MRLLTIGFTQKPASRFFELIREHGAQVVLDIRLHPDGQLAGFAKRADLPYFLKELAECDYLHVPELAPTEEIMKGFREGKNWAGYERQFEMLMDERDIPGSLDRSMFKNKTCCLLCSEAKPTHCHRRLIAERIARTWDDVDIVHLT